MILSYREEAKKALQRDVDIEEVLEAEVRAQIARAKYLPATEKKQFDQIKKDITAQLSSLRAKEGF